MNRENGKPRYQLLDSLRADELAALRADIANRGVLIPIERDEHGFILDGHNRYAIAQDLGVPCPEIVRRFATESDKRAHVIMINLARRHFDPIRWGQAFSLLLKERGVKSGQGARNDQAKVSEPKPSTTSEPKAAKANLPTPKPTVREPTSATVAEVKGVAELVTRTVEDVAKELGIPYRTARQRVRKFEEYDSLPDDLKGKVDRKESSVAQAKREVARAEKRADMEAKAAVVRAAPKASVPTWGIIEGDSLEILQGIKSGTVRLIFADPPYNIGVNYGDHHNDEMTPDDFMEWSETWIRAAAATLTPDGSMWVLINDEWADVFGCLLRDAGLYRRSWIKWYESFGVNTSNNFNRCSRHLFYMVKDRERFVFNADAVSRPSDRQTKYGDKRADPGGKVWDNVWGLNPEIPRLVENAKERIPDFPTQLPLSLLLPVVGCATEPGDLVLDPFNGSGTTGEASIRLGRRYVGIEQSTEFARLARLRLTAAQGDS